MVGHSPLISIIVPVYNAERYLEVCLDSIKNQTFDSFEVLMVNDGSTDNSLQICEKYVEDSRFVLINQENQGVSVARNVGIENSNGLYLAFVDSDDYVGENYLLHLSNAVCENTDYIVSGIIYYNEYKLLKKNQKIIRHPLDSRELADCYDLYLKEMRSRIPEPCFGAPYGKLFKKDIIYKNNIKFEVSENLAEDLVFNLTYIYHISSISVVKESDYYYRMFVADSLSRIQHDYQYSKKRWEKVGTEYNKLMLSRSLECGTRIEDIKYYNILNSIMLDKQLKRCEKKEAFSKETERYGKRVSWVSECVKMYVKCSIKSIYRMMQFFVYRRRSKKNEAT